MEDILIACVDGLKGFPDAIRARFPKTEIQRCIVHSVRYCMKSVSYNDRKSVMKSLREIYRTVNEDDGLAHLEKLEESWMTRFSIICQHWRSF